MENFIGLNLFLLVTLLDKAFHPVGNIFFKI